VAPVPGEVVEVGIERLGSRGDGIAEAAGTRLFVPFALPGERLRVRITGARGDGHAAEPLERLTEAPRATPSCRHFGVCGGCQLQHVPAPDYAVWKRAQVVEALARRGLGQVAVEATVATPPGRRRRARLAFVRTKAGVRLGFRARTGHEVVDLAVCPVVLPAIEALLEPLRAMLAHLPMARRGEVLLTATLDGLDLLLITETAPALADREELAAFADAADLARIAWRPRAGAPAEPIVVRRRPRVAFAGITVEPPPGAFLQASVEAEAAIRAAVREALGDVARVADLFAGCGTLALPLAREGRTVQAIDLDRTMLDALIAAARSAGLGARVETAPRDLERRPLDAAELARFDGVLLDPPRAGARAQAERLARAGVERVAMVSCHPPSFARDARLLVDGGYRLHRVRPIDAFLWSSRIELVGSFTRRRSAAG